MKKINNQNGQVVLVVMLVSALILTLGLSASRQATVETRINTDEELLKQAFNTAESGVDYYLSTGNLGYSGSGSITTGLASLSVTNVGGGTTLAVENVTPEGSTELFWLMSHKPVDGKLDITSYYTGNSVKVCSQNRSLDGNFKIDYFYKNGGNYGVTRNYVSTSNGCADVVVNLVNRPPILLAVTPVNFQAGSSIRIEIDGGLVNFPIQGEEISSTGTVGKVNNTVRAMYKYTVPAFMLEAITSNGNISNK